MERYLIINLDDQSVGTTRWFDPENCFPSDVPILIIDLAKGIATTDGEEWNEIEIDHL